MVALGAVARPARRDGARDVGGARHVVLAAREQRRARRRRPRPHAARHDRRAGGAVARAAQQRRRSWCAASSACSARIPASEPEGLLTFRVRSPPEFFPKPTDLIGFQDRVERRSAAIPGVTGVSATSALPLHGVGGPDADHVPGRAREHGLAGSRCAARRRHRHACLLRPGHGDARRRRPRLRSGAPGRPAGSADRSPARGRSSSRTAIRSARRFRGAAPGSPRTTSRSPLDGYDGRRGRRTGATLRRPPVTRRRHEMAVRLALGADHRRVLLLVLGEGALLAGIGVLIGIPVFTLRAGSSAVC